MNNTALSLYPEKDGERNRPCPDDASHQLDVVIFAELQIFIWRKISVGLDHAKAVLNSCFVSILVSTCDYVECVLVKKQKQKTLVRVGVSDPNLGQPIQIRNHGSYWRLFAGK